MFGFKNQGWPKSDRTFSTTSSENPLATHTGYNCVSVKKKISFRRNYRAVFGLVEIVEGRSRFSSHCTEVRFASLLSGGFTTMAVIKPPEKKLANCTSVNYVAINYGKNYKC